MEHQYTFEGNKGLVPSHECLMTIDHQNPGKNEIYVTCDASKWHTGVILSFGKSWELARPVAFKSQQLKGAELHYPVHEQEMLSIMHALTKWRVNFWGCTYTFSQTTKPFKTLTDNRTCCYARLGGWNIYHNTNTRSHISKVKIIPWLTHFPE